jgi:NOL1/NOP2/sun family putative RNA methylase
MKMKNRTYEPKLRFVERMKLLLRNEKDVKEFFECSKSKPMKSLRVNTLKINPEELKKRLLKKGWKIRQLTGYPEIVQVQSELEPGEIGTTIEHLLGYYYVQEITSMMPLLALNPKPGELLLDLCASPGSKTTQAASIMKNKGNIIANDISVGRIVVLSANLERCSVTNTIITRHPGNELAEKLNKLNFRFDKILVDAPCSGEGNIRCSPRTFLEWSEPLLRALSKKQRRIAGSAIQLLKPGGEMVYSTCTHAPEENEEVVQYLLDNFDLEIMPVRLPIKTRPGITEWGGRKFSKELKKAVRIYHHDNDMEGFFLCKIRKIK